MDHHNFGQHADLHDLEEERFMGEGWILGVGQWVPSYFVLYSVFSFLCFFELWALGPGGGCSRGPLPNSAEVSTHLLVSCSALAQRKDPARQL